MTILVFPSAVEASVAFAREARNWGQRTIGASSLDHDPNADHFDAWAKLPYIGADGFFEALAELVRAHGVDRIYTPHAPTFHLLETQLKPHLPALRLIGKGPFETEMDRVRTALAAAQDNLSIIDSYADRPTNFPRALLAGMMEQVSHLHGECSVQKILALCAIAPSAPAGDVIEIGCLYGKSSYVLNRLAAHFGRGTTLGIDPWNLALSVQHDAPDNIQLASGGWNWETVYQGFLINMLGCAAAPFNYLRATSEAAEALYRSLASVTSPEFGTTALTGRIAILHIDGNHDEAAVQQDFDLWRPHLLPNAWIIFDDYHWPHGKGPRVVADRAIAMYGSRVTRHFVGGGAMFVQLTAP